MPTCRVYRETLRPSSCLSEWPERVQPAVLFWSSLGAVYDTDIGPFQGQRTSPAPPFLAPYFRCLRRRECLSAIELCAAATLEPHLKKNLRGSITFRSRS